MGRLFGTDGIRGIAGDELTAKIAYKLGMAVSDVLGKFCKNRPFVLIGKDTRLSGDMFQAAITAGLCAMGADVGILGVVPTPAVAFLIKKLGADAGIMISASHNPSEYNGIKVFNSEGFKLSDEFEARVESVILDGAPLVPATGSDIGRVTDLTDKLSDYNSHVIKVLSPISETPQKKRKLLFDLSNGSASSTAKTIFTSENIYGYEAEFIACAPNGVNINDNCGSTRMSDLSRRVAVGDYDIGIAFDGDADRCLMTDENGHIIDGDMIMARFALEMKKDGNLKTNAVVVTKLTNLGFHIMAKANGIDVSVTDVGDRYVLEEMLRSGANLGGEQSGHVILTDYATTGDGQVTAATAIYLLAKYPDTPASELFSAMKPLPQVSVNVKVPNSMKRVIATEPSVANEVAIISDELGERGRILLRPSGTEALVRIMLEGENEAMLIRYANRVSDKIEEMLCGEQ